MRTEILLDLLSRAADEPLGLVIETNNPSRMVLILHEARRTLPDCDIQIATPSTPNTVFLVQRSVELDP